ncbi:hypothetical protein [Halegenticoccus soli]|uniref:hypothetical protein n=1 Tax=Halegenticoccus soli TaxID=1985678 RepID=UPI0018EBC10A|nr:hypothetical protein [Halegenticoccus soli]
MDRDLPETAGYSPLAVLGSAVGGLVIAFLSVWWAAGNAVSAESLFRVAPTVENRGVGSDWVAGNTIEWLDFLIALTHAADVIMGVFILVMVFVHWAAFRRLAGRMRRPGEPNRGDGVAADGGGTAKPVDSSGTTENAGGDDSGGERP